LRNESHRSGSTSEVQSLFAAPELNVNRLSNGECNFTLYGVFSDLRYSFFFFFLFDPSVMAVGAFGS